MTSRRFWFIALLGCLSAFALHRLLPSFRHQSSVSEKLRPKPVSVSAISRSLRPNYPYSVVPGGVYSPAELKSATQKDSLVQAHYADFRVQNAHLIANSTDRFQYVSFRMNGKIFWTHQKLHIPKGEVLLTDGKTFCRTRCGNRLSDQPQRETTAMEPSEHVLNLPPFRPELLNSGELSLLSPPDLGLLAPAEGLGQTGRLAPLLPQGDEAALSVPQSELGEPSNALLSPAGFLGLAGVPGRTRASAGSPTATPSQSRPSVPGADLPGSVPPGSIVPVPTVPGDSTPDMVPPSSGPVGGPVGGGPIPPVPPGLKTPVVPITAIPEPSTSAMASLAFGFAIYLGWRKAKSSA